MMTSKERQDVLRLWRKFVGHLLDAQKVWQEFQPRASVLKGTDIEYFPIEMQRVLSVATFRKAKFDLALERFIETWRKRGGLERFQIALPSSGKKAVEEGKGGTDDE